MKTKNRKKIFIIAEIGINHEGDVTRCAEMIREAKKSGANAVKLQTISADENYVKDTESYSVFKDSELTRDETKEMFDLAKKIGLEIFTTSGDIDTIDWVDKLNPCCWKISSGLLTHIPLIRYISALGRPLLFSTGMANEKEISNAIAAARLKENNNISILQCTSIYPAPPHTLNLSNINWLKDQYGYDVGFSDHSIGIEAAILSVGAGATIIEKHFSYDTSRQGFDHKISLGASDFKKMTEGIRRAETMLGNKGKEISIELDNARQRSLRSVIAVREIKSGQIIKNNDIGVRRTSPGQQGFSPEKSDIVIGCIAKKDIDINQSLNNINVDCKEWYK